MMLWPALTQRIDGIWTPAVENSVETTPGNV